MKKTFLAVAACAVASVCCAALSDNPTLRIMPLGDSITYGSCSELGGGYRAPLWNLLTNGNYNVDFVGTQTSNPRKDGSLGDVDHEGHGGWRLSSSSVGVYENINAWFSQIDDPHVILLHLGTNDTGDGDATFRASCTNRLVKLLDRIYACQPSAKIIVTTLIKRTDNASKNTMIAEAYNPFIEQIVADQVAKGQAAYFLDMYEAFDPDTGLYTDGLHPSDVGYAQMADAWYAKIQEIIPDPTDCGGENAPAVVHETKAASISGTTVTLHFNQEMDATFLANAANWTVTGASTTPTISVGSGNRSVTFTFGTADFDRSVTVAATAVPTASGNLTTDVSRTFTCSRGPGIANNVPAASIAGYELVYDLSIPANNARYERFAPVYATDNHLKVGAYSRVGYYLELQKADGTLQYVWVSLDAFTDDPGKLGVPTIFSGAVFQKDVSNLFIQSNVSGLRTNETIAVGNIEFWPYTYSQANARGLSGASASHYDYDDTMTTGGRYGSMQIHDTATKTPVFSYCRWNGYDSAQDIGIGPCGTISGHTDSRDWTFAQNTDAFSLRHLQVYVLPTPAATGPALVSAVRDYANSRITATFDVPVADDALAGCFSLSGGVVGAVKRDAADYRVVTIECVDAPADVKLTVAGVRETSSAFLPMAEAVTVTPTAGDLPASITSKVSAELTAGYDVVYALDIPTSGSLGSSVPYSLARTDYRASFDRVAYFMELVNSSGATNWIWTSMDAFSPSIGRVGVPNKVGNAVGQVWVKNQDVASNVSGVTNGRNMDGGFLEFWALNYNQANPLNIPGASANVFDWGDRLESSGNHGCMQVHNVTNRQVLFAMNNFNGTIGLGIGNNPNASANSSNGQVDWTFTNNAGSWKTRRLWVLVRPGDYKVQDEHAAPARIAANVPEAEDYSLLYELTLPGSNVQVRKPASYTSYHTVDNRKLFGDGHPARVAYYLELVKNGVTNWCWTAFDSVTDDLALFSFPTNKSLQQKISNLDVRSSVASVNEVTGWSQGNIEFFCNDYSVGNKLNLPGADASKYDYDDTMNDGGSFGCMQVHNWGAKQTCWAVGHLNAGDLDIGIGNNYAIDAKPDWTQSGYGPQYSSRKLFVFLSYKGVAPRASLPTIRRVTPSLDRRKLCVEFTAEAPAEYDVADFSVSGGTPSGNGVATVERAAMDTGRREFILTMREPLVAGTSYTLTCVVSSGGAAQQFTKTFTPIAAAPAPAFASAETVDEFDDYQLVNQYDFATGGRQITANGADYVVDESRFGVPSFDRIAYLLELVGTNGVSRWAWVSMDAFTSDAAKIALPTVRRVNHFQRYVDNMHVYAGSSDADFFAAMGIVTGVVARGNIEFFTSDYSQGNEINIPGASASVFDWGDKAGYTDGLHSGYGCMQIHNYAAAQTIISCTCLRDTPALGIGNDTVATSYGVNPDFTHHGNASTFSTRRLWVYVRPKAAAAVDSTRFLLEPQDQALDRGSDAVFSVSADGAVSYQWFLDGQPVAGATGRTFRLAGLDAGTYVVKVVATFGDGTEVASRDATATVSWPAAPDTPLVRIMPLGDSITYGAVGGGGSYQGGYRWPLYKMLTNANYRVKLVGSQTTMSDGLPADANHHEGHSGWKIKDTSNGLWDKFYEWARQIENPHVVLVHIGTNDSGDDTGFRTAIDRLDLLIERISDTYPGAIIVVSTLLERSATNYNRIKSYFNPYVAERVALHRAKGRKVRFCDMNAYVPLADMPDNLHPNEVGYGKMAQGWFDAITDIWPSALDVEVDNTPGIIGLTSTATGCAVEFGQPVDPETATNVANYALSPAVAFTKASLSADGRTATLTSSGPLPAGLEYTLTVTGVKDVACTATMPGTARTFFISIPQGIENNVPAADREGFHKVYEYEIPASKANIGSTRVKYTVDNHLATPPVGRVAYYLELRKPDENLQWVWVAMDSFTKDPAKIGVPAYITGAEFQQIVSNLVVRSNVAGVRTGEIPTGNVEMWPQNYSGGAIAANGLGGTSSLDFDDTRNAFSSGYGSFQVHDYLNKTTIFAYNRWNNGNDPQDLGIGNCPLADTKTTAGTVGTDWTFLMNSSGYDIRHLEVWATADTTPEASPAPVPVRALRSGSGRQVTLDFDVAVSVDQDLAALISFSDDSQVFSAERSRFDAKRVIVTLSEPCAASGLTVTVSGVRSDTPRATAMPAPVALPVADGSIPDYVLAKAGAALTEGYQLVYDLPVPIKGDWNSNANGIYAFDDARFFSGPFDRVGYFFQLEYANGTTNWVWASMDAFMGNAEQTGIPLSTLGYYYQQRVSNLDVKSNLSSITDGTGYDWGVVEMWPTDYSSPNALGITNSTNSAYYDWGDTRSTSGSYGSFQVHNAGKSQVLFAINHWGANNNSLCVGIGSASANNIDYTFADNAGNFVARRLCVFVRPTSSGAPFADATAAQLVPEAAEFDLLYDIDVPPYPKFNDATSNALCHVVNNEAALTSRYGSAGKPKRVAYLVEYEATAGNRKWVWTAFDAFDKTLKSLDVPSAYVKQARVANLDVRSNVLTERTGVQTGCIEFNRYNYSAGTSQSLPGGSGSAFDFDDTMGTSGSYGCMQVHDFGARETLWALNNFNTQSADGVCFGIGNASGSNPDHTHVFTAKNYASRRIRVFVQYNSPDSAVGAAPSLRRAIADGDDLARVCASFDAAPRSELVPLESFSLAGATILSAEVSSIDPRDVILTLAAPLAANTSHSLVYTEPLGRIKPKTVSFTTPRALPAVLSQIDESGDYLLVNELNIGSSVYYSCYGADYRTDVTRFTPYIAFDRVAYLLELTTTNGVAKWVWTSMDAFTQEASKIGVPSVQRGILFQQYVSNLHVRASANANVRTGEWPRGNIEFWPSNYNENNDKNVPDADANAEKIFDWGDGGAGSSYGFGSMQVHNFMEREVVWAFNRFGSSSSPTATSVPSLGIGNNTGSTSLDWTHSANAANFSVRNLYVFVRPAALPASAGAFDLQPADHRVKVGSPRFQLEAFAFGAKSYQWRRNGVAIAGATGAWIEIDPRTVGTDEYDVVATLANGSVVGSAAATVEVYPSGTQIFFR